MYKGEPRPQAEAEHSEGRLSGQGCQTVVEQPGQLPSPAARALALYLRQLKPVSAQIMKPVTVSGALRPVNRNPRWK